MPFTRPDIVRPPSEWKSYFLPLTRGCSNNTCIFCSYYGSRLQLREVEQVKREIDALSLYRRSGIVVSDMPPIVYAVARSWDGRRVFLQDADAMVYPYPKMVEVLTYLREKLPEVERVGAYATPRDLLRRSVEELRTLRDLGLGIIYLGVETGDAALLERIGKKVSYDQMVEAGRRAKEAGITLSVTVILGLGGVEGSERHARETARILSDIDPEYAGALTLTLVPGTPLYEETEKGLFHPISPFQSLQELKVLVEQVSFTSCFFSSMHASNYYSVRGTLPQDRDKMLAELEQVLARRDPVMLRPEYLRGL